MKVPKRTTLYVGAKKLSAGAEINPLLEKRFDKDLVKSLKAKEKAAEADEKAAAEKAAAEAAAAEKAKKTNPAGGGSAAGGGGGGTTKP